MQIGVHFPQAEIDPDPSVIRDFAQTVEGLGFSHVNMPDHVIQTRTPRGPLPLANNYTTEFPHHETMTTLTFIAAVTSTLGLKSAVLIMPQRPAVLVAKQAAELDLLSGGRLQMGLGIGWNEAEYEALDMQFSNRARRLEEQIEVMRKLWTEEHVTYAGEWHTINDAGLAPMPFQRPIPIWIGAIADAAVRRAGRLADGWQVIAFDQQSDSTAEKFELFRTAAREAGRDASTLGIEATLFAGEGGPDAWAEGARQWIEAGATQLVFRPPGNFADIMQAIESFGPLVKEL
ncbi:MAG: LLM class F420-dependent oxidoreductase [Pseudomonadota bacterium]